ncbi:hypothetical protein [Desulfosporosinus sp. BICA1-9]|uniref:hypothetical protein n=1 Tax=Desulfosporosinus sp. BICA1-9 TaxID=1531958 RepID=UPI00054BA412|nr:hypothetical protein [Desulfosporosinus sp. BICA1-9]KJS49043.1 MAG: hypothetical protein VR66_10685 [Peptococcaceae bacterium BRH_c23]KJS78518.1 MAG: hypothetical protein JL57_31450 [Desulfosporosinus sp. BICA1-9]HBW35996.1 hypothetical protein [Desulfosporosinus sp.]
MKKAITLIVVVLLLALVAGCQKSTQGSPGQAPEKMMQEAALKYEEITDPVELEKLWQEYFYDSIATLGNTHEFNTAQDIDPLDVAMYCWFKYVAEHGKESLVLADTDSTNRLFPLDTVLEYAERYFNLTSLDVSNLEAGSYDQQKRAFIFDFGTPRTRPSYNAVNSWGDHLDKVTRSSDGTVTAILVHSGPPQSGRIELTKSYNLKQNEDGSLYFVSGRLDYVNNHLVVLTGDYQYFAQIKGFAGNMEELSMLGEVDGKLILAYTPNQKRGNASLMLVKPETMNVEKKLDVSGNFTPTDVSLIGESIVIRLKDRIIAIDKTLEQSKMSLLPITITEKINREPHYNAQGNPDVFFGGYDVSSDRLKYVYTDETGVKLFNSTDNTEKLLSPTVPITGSELLENSFHRDPRFVADEQKVITTMTGYEGAMGYTLCNLESGTVEVHNIASECSSTGLIRYDTGLLEVNTYLYNKLTQMAESKLLFLDFWTGRVKELSLKYPGDTGDIRMPDSWYVGQNYATFITYKRDDSDNAKDMFYLNRLNHNTLLTEPKVISVKAAKTHILGVLADGRIVFWYNLNPSENGVCITK